MTSTRRRVVITGVGAITPLGNRADTLIDRWMAAESGIADGVARCLDFDFTVSMTRREAKRFDRFTQMAIVAADEAVGQAGWGTGLPCASERIGCIVGSGVGGIQTALESIKIYDERGPQFVSPLGIPKMMVNAPSGVLALRFGLRGPAFGIVSACASSADAIAVAVRLIRADEVDAVLTGGAEACINGLTLASFGVMEALSPTGNSRPFDVRRDGFVMGEGAGLLTVEALEVAEARGAPVLAEILGHGASNDAFHLVAPPPEGTGAQQALRSALLDAAIDPADVAYVNAHGTGTPLNDEAETAALKAVLGEAAYAVPISSLKSAIGHLIGAAGAVESIATVLALDRRVAPPTLNLEKPDAKLDLDYVPLRGRPLSPAPSGHNRLIALSNSFGFGGHNNVLVFAA